MPDSCSGKVKNVCKGIVSRVGYFLKIVKGQSRELDHFILSYKIESASSVFVALMIF